ncbi:MAG TPA: RHS repeat-associated core domain-containing protein, partial [Flavipsychrobacter sp.]|nr:RHS repeat-associated core domain-containing protein [Flavipsychrobacter sp.]
DLYAAQLLGTDPSKQVSTALMLHVMPGDKFSITAQSYYDGSVQNNIPDMQTLAGSVMQALSGGSGVTIGGDMTQGQQAVQSTFGNQAFAGIYNSLLMQNYDQSKPAVFLNYLVLDENFNVIPGSSAALQINGQPGSWGTLGTQGTVSIDRPGYLLFYGLSMASTVAYLDNVDVTYYAGNVLEEDHYYPFGLTLVSSAMPVVPNNIKFNSKEWQHNEFTSATGAKSGLEWYDYGARMQDPQLGRWFQIDPLTEQTTEWTPYGYTNDNPVKFIDPDGGSNTIYLVALPNSGLTADDISNIVNTGNSALATLGINAQIKVFDGNPLQFDKSNLDPTDLIAAVGKKEDVINFYKTIGASEDYMADLQSLGEGTTPEESVRGGNEIAVESSTLRQKAKELKSNIATTGAWTILHGAGHNADANSDHNDHEGFELRWGGIHVAQSINPENGYVTTNVSGEFIFPKDYGDRISSLKEVLNNEPYGGVPRNQGYIGLMKSKFDNSSPQDNYNRNAATNQYNLKFLQKLLHFNPKGK